MTNKVKIEVERLIKEYDLNCSVEEVRCTDCNIIWNRISYYQRFSEDFIREFKGGGRWNIISASQELSHDFIYEFKDELDLDYLIKNNKITKEKLKELKEINSIHSRFEILDIR